VVAGVDSGAVRNAGSWKPTKIVRDATGRYVANPAHVGVGSRFIVDLAAEGYVRLLRTYASGVMLDCGCGAIPWYEVYRDRVAETVCIDWEQSPHRNEHIDRFVDLNEPLPFPDERFDTVLLTDVLAHVARPSVLVSELGRVLRPAGTLLVATPFLYWLNEQPHDYYRYTEFGLRHLCRDAGLDVVELDAYGGYPDVLLDLLNKKLVRGERSARAYLALTRRIAATAAYRRLRERTKQTFPLGYFVAARKP
jgi:SAM-dependent methyltransferase